MTQIPAPIYSSLISRFSLELMKKSLGSPRTGIPPSSTYLSLLECFWIYPLGDRRKLNLLWVGHRRLSWPRFEESLSFQCSYCSTWDGDLENSFLSLETIYQKFVRVILHRPNKILDGEKRGFVKKRRKVTAILCMCVVTAGMKLNTELWLDTSK